MRSNFVASPACTVLFLGFFSFLAPLYVSAEDDVIDITRSRAKTNIIPIRTEITTTTAS